MRTFAAVEDSENNSTDRDDTQLIIKNIIPKTLNYASVSINCESTITMNHLCICVK